MLIEILQQTINGLAIGGVYVLIALGLTTVFGFSGSPISPMGRFRCLAVTSPFFW